MPKRLSKQQKRDIANLARQSDRAVNTSDIAEWTPEMFARAEVGKFYRPKKMPVTIRLDADVLAWLKNSGEGYQTRVNEYLRSLMLKTPGAH